MLIKIPNMCFIHFMSLELIKITQTCLIFWNLLGALINKGLIKISNLPLICFITKKYFKNTQKCCYFRIYYVVIINKSTYEKLKQ